MQKKRQEEEEEGKGREGQGPGERRVQEKHVSYCFSSILSCLSDT